MSSEAWIELGKEKDEDMDDLRRSIQGGKTLRNVIIGKRGENVG